MKARLKALERNRQRQSVLDASIVQAAPRQVPVVRAGTNASERLARYRALHGGLTALPNRCHFLERLDSAVRAAQGHRSRVAVLYMDLDGFKPIVDTHGHQVGDELLRIVAARLACAVRAEDMVSRVGGDEFACLIEGAAEVEHFGRLARKLSRTISAPMRIGALQVAVRASIGIALSPDDGQTSEVLLKHADEAMYRARSSQVDYAYFDKRVDT